jgi:RNA polymerase-associated protein CTR9
MTSAETPMPIPNDERIPSVLGVVSTEKQDNVAKSLFIRGSRILRRQGSKFNIAATVDEEDEVGKVTSRFEVADLFHRKSRPNESRKLLRKSLQMQRINWH